MIDRRGLLYTGCFAAAGGWLTAAQAAPPGGSAIAADAHVQPAGGRDQTGELQKALDASTQAGQPLVLAAGTYLTGALTLPKGCVIIGTPGLTVLRARSDGPLLVGEKLGTCHLSGIAFEGAGGKSASALLAISGATLTLGQCRFGGTAAAAVKLENCSGIIHSIEIAGTIGTGIAARESASLTIAACRILSCDSAGIAVSAVGGNLAGFTVTQNHLGGCAVGILAEGAGIVNGNTVTGAGRFGLKLGSAKGDGHILAQSNLLRGCRVAIGVAASGDDIMASLNMISGAKEGAIRAFDGDRLVGPDLARQSAEAYLNLMVAGNVVR